jgi:hypothetical protein
VAGRLVGEIRLSADGVTRMDLGELVGRVGGRAARGVYFIETGSAGTAKVLLLK